MDFMDYIVTNKKKKLDFEGNSFRETQFKVPCQDVTNNIGNDSEQQTKSRVTSASCFGDDEESSRDSEASSVSAVSVGNRDTVNVFLRLKPGTSIPLIYSFDDETAILKGSQSTVDRLYKFTSVLQQSTDQKTVYETCVRSFLTNPFNESGAVFASYGVSNSGKTFTILGEKSAGIVPRALAQLFYENHNQIAIFPYVKVANDQIQILDDAQVDSEVAATRDFLQESRGTGKGKQQNSLAANILEEHTFKPKPLANDQKIFIWISFVEIYNEKMIDLFKPAKQVKAAAARTLRIISNNRNSYVHGLTWLHVDSLEKALELLQAGVRRVNYAATGMNQHSSRSHTIFTINIISECDSNYEFSSYKFCDLAGAERISKTGNVGERLKEAGGINTSLMVLGKCLEAVLHNQKPGIVKKDIVPVRESKLTFLLQSSLMGRERFVMIVNLLPTVECYEENINVLHFGSIANKITTRKTEVRRYSRMSTRYSYFMSNVNSPKMNSSVLGGSVISEDEECDESSNIGTSFMSADELRRVIRLRDVEIATLRKAFEESERQNINQRQQILREVKECSEKQRQSDKKYYEENEERTRDYYEKKMASISDKYERKLNEANEYIDLLTYKVHRLNKKLGIKEDDDVIDLNSEEDESGEDEEEEVSLAQDEIENFAP